jgi:hypothetical protein
MTSQISYTNDLTDPHLVVSFPDEVPKRLKNAIQVA